MARSATCARAATILGNARAGGRGEFEFRCGACHTVRGTAAGGTSGPDLTHLMSRQSHRCGDAAQFPGDACRRDRKSAGAKSLVRACRCYSFKAMRSAALTHWLVTLR